ncbi:MAG: helix-hairpin-helix domain-containing protein [Polyangia bacterium]
MSEIPNAEVADRLDEAAQLLEQQGANPFRCRAYQRAAAFVRSLERPVAAIWREEGEEGLLRLPGIGPHLMHALRDLVQNGRLGMVDRLRGETDPVALLSSLPGIGERTAERLHTELGIETLWDLEHAARAGRLARLGFGPKRTSGLRDCLAQRLGRARTPLEPPAAAPPEPPVAELLDVDREYCDKAAAGLLHRIAPRRHNPHHEAWLPVLHTHRVLERPGAHADRHYTALFSNTAQAHKLHKTHDWVVLYYHDDVHDDRHDGHAGGEPHERQCTVVTARSGPLTGRRVVRGREGECARYYEEAARSAPAPRDGDDDAQQRLALG